MAEKVDVVIVGGGPAGIACAYTLAKAGVETIVFERGEYPGAKNVMGGILFTNALAKLIPDFREKAPVERPVTKRKFLAVSEKDALGVETGFSEFSKPPYNNNFTVLRARFDQWFAAQAEEAGAMILSETVVDDFIYDENKKIIGVKTRRDDGDILCNCVVLADGVNSLLAKKAGLRSNFKPKDFVVGVKMVLGLPKEKICERFSLESDNDGAAYEFFGAVTNNILGSGFIYTNRESISIGLGVALDGACKHGLKPYELLDRFMEHPYVRPLVKDGEPIEYSAHLLPEGGYQGMPKVFADNVLVCGDAASFVNTSVYHEGSNLAMESGILAAKAVMQARGRGDFSAKSLMKYAEYLEESIVIKDLKKYERLPAFLHSSPHLFTNYLDLAIELAKDYFTVDELSKGERQKLMFKKAWGRVSVLQLISDAYKSFRSFIWN